MKRKLYDVQCGATYWVWARNLREAVDLIFACWEQEGSLEDVGDGFEIGLVPPKRAERMKFKNDDGTTVPMLEEAARHGESLVLACSEWP